MAMASVAEDVAPYELSSPSLLAMQPPSPRESRQQADADWQTLYNYLEARMTALRNWRWSWWAFWAVLARFFIPRRYLWLVVANRMWRGHPLNDAIIDSTGQLAVRTCKAGMWTGLTSPSRPWFKLGIALPWVELDPDGLEWLEDVEKRLYTVLSQSNFYSAMAQGFEDVITFGTAPVLILEDFEDVVRFYNPAAGEYYLANSARLAVTTHAREFTYTVQQIVDFFTLENCPSVVQKLWNEGVMDTEFVVCHMIEPNFALDRRAPRGKKGSGGKYQPVSSKFTWREVYWLKGMKTERPFTKKGFSVQPFIALRWATVGNEPYGRGPTMDALGDVKQSQTQTYRKAEYIEKGVRPPMGANPELRTEPASIMPGMTTYTSTEGSKKGFWPLFEVKPEWLAGLSGDIKLVNERVEHCLFVDLFMAISRMEGVQPRNELELTKRDLERLQELGPVIDLAEKELNQLVLRCLDIMTRRRLLKPMPESLAGIPLKIKYISILKLAQNSAESLAIKDTLATGAGLSKAAQGAGVPDPIRIINLDKTLRHLMDLGNFPADCIYTDKEVGEHDKIRAQAQQQAQMPQHAAAAAHVAKTLSQAEIPGKGNALAAMMPGAMSGAQAGAPAAVSPV